MDSPFASPFFYQNNFILPEEAIFSSQPTLPLLDIEDEKMQKAPELSVVVIDKEQKEETSDGIVLKGKSKGKPTKVSKNGTAMASMKGKPVATKKGNKAASKNDGNKKIGMDDMKMQKVILPSVVIIDVDDGQTENATNATAATPKKGKAAVSKNEDNKKIEIDEEKLKKVVEPSVVIIDEGQTEDATSGIIAVEISGEENMKVKSMEQLKSYLRDILQMDRSNLKQLCKDKGVLTKGGPTLTHKYVFALFQDALMQP